MKKNNIYILRKLKNILDKYNIIIFLLACAFIFSLKSPSNIWYNGDTSTDSSVFKMIALMIDRGYMPYRDSFDHKGPLIYLINLIGIKISINYGIWIIEFITLFITFTGMYKIARLLCGKTLSFISMLISTPLLFDCFQGGNFVEEYAMAPITVSLYIFLDYFINHKINLFRLCTCGIGFGIVCLLRPNMISLWIVFCIAVLIYCIQYHYISDINKFIIFFLVGFCIIVLPILLWILINGSFHLFIEDYINFNRVYVSSEGGQALLGAKWNTFFIFLSKTLVLFSVIITVYMCKIAENTFLYRTYFFYLLCTLIFICMSGTGYFHYGMILVPAVVFPIASLYKLCTTSSNNKSILLLITIYLLGSVTLPNWLTITGDVINIYNNKDKDHHSAIVNSVCDIIKTNTSTNDKITVYGNWDIIYILSDRIHSTKYSYQFPIGTVLPDIMNEYFEELEKELPGLVVIQPGRLDEKMLKFLNNYRYVEIWSQADSKNQYTKIYKIE